MEEGGKGRDLTEGGGAQGNTGREVGLECSNGGVVMATGEAAAPEMPSPTLCPLD